MNEDTGGGQRPGRLATVLAGAALLVAACSGGSPAATASASNGLPGAAMVDSFASCVRSHGFPDFYFSRNTHSGGDTPDDLLKIGPWVAPGDPNSAHFQAALKACNHLLPLRRLSPAQQQSMLRQLLKQAACIRAHGFPDYPDPSANGNGIVQPPLPSDIDPSSRQFQAAQQTCSKG